MRVRITILAALNLDYDEWKAAFPNKLLAGATLDRMRDGAYRVTLDGETRRKPRPLPDDRGAKRAQPLQFTKTTTARTSS